MALAGHMLVPVGVAVVRFHPDRHNGDLVGGNSRMRRLLRGSVALVLSLLPGAAQRYRLEKPFSFSFPISVGLIAAQRRARPDPARHGLVLPEMFEAC